MPSESASTTKVGNYITDGRFDFWTADSQNSNGYGSATMWYNYQFAATGTFIRKIPLNVNEIPEVPTAKYCMQISTTGTYAVVSQPIEEVRTLAGSNAVLSFWAKGNLFGSVIRTSIKQHYVDSNGSLALVVTDGPDIAVSTLMERYTADFSIPPLQEYTDEGYIEVMFTFAGNQTFHLACVQLQVGNTADYFEELTPQDALLRLNRYYYTSPVAEPFSFGAYNSGEVQTFVYPLPAAMRGLPNVYLDNTTGDITASAMSTSAIRLTVTSSGITPPPPTTPPAPSPAFPAPTTVSATIGTITADARF